MILEAKDLNYYYQDGESRRFVLKNTNVSFDKGKFYTILGQSGSGKTTLLSLLSAMDTPHNGEVVFDGRNILEIGHDNYRRNKVGIIFQSYNLIPTFTAVENVLVSMSITENELPDDHKTVAYNLLDYIGISQDKANRTVNKLSGGEQQRVAIARALSTNVELILADEPTGNLDEEMEQEIINIFKKLAHEHEKCVIMVTHSNDIAEQSDQTFYLKKGVLNTNE
ncbi:ABC transporter ATP-binding protein [Gracilibacillus thailandensis]|uniref:ATP-binding cassette domain-containing protein n=1 Tax=Gracilibacillus thailandensis TaxID=563735 RepID=A0A6N7QU40_9BACI|nr:ABC transporter ATP-binding protein [Gracilibacillus thailandensis]MRI65044.1 ATP-binding cassette domain-containing protein [Gracilibacillus thailandensis]